MQTAGGIGRANLQIARKRRLLQLIGRILRGSQSSLESTPAIAPAERDVPERVPARTPAGPAVGKAKSGWIIPEQRGKGGDMDSNGALLAWALREVAPWRLAPGQSMHAADAFDRLNTAESWCAVYDFADGDVTLRPKPASLTLRENGRYRLYLDFFKSVTPFLPPGYCASICLGVDDRLDKEYDFPIFCFQKTSSERSLLLPDIDFLLSDFSASPVYEDELDYEDKTQTAVFAGATSGGGITLDTAMTFSLPRLRAARFFEGSDVVDFRLPNIQQCVDNRAKDFLASQSFCQKPSLSWQAQFRHRFIISIDGNGATCSRVAVALASQSVLLKYESEHVLFYFRGLQPWLHYVPVATDQDVFSILQLESEQPELFKAIAKNGTAFAKSYLSRESIIRYTAHLLTLYESLIFPNKASAQLAQVPRPDAGLAGILLTSMLAHIANIGDQECRQGQWLGTPGSGLPIEGFSIFLGPGVKGDGFSYQIALRTGSFAAPVGSEVYVGTRGKSLPVYGFRILVEPPFSEKYTVSYEASFVDGTRVGPLAAGEPCRSLSNAALEAMRLTLQPLVPALASERS